MDLLESLQPEDIKGQLIWCYYEGGKPSERILNVVTDLNGVLVPVPDFDLLMVLLGEKMGIALMDEEIESRAVKRAERYRDRIQKLDTVKYPSVTKALAATFERSGGWWAWEQKARLEKDAARQEAVYRQGLQHYPKSAELHGNFAIFQWEVCKNAAEADRLYRKAVDLDPKSVNHLANYVEFLLATSQLPDASKTLKLAQSLNKGRKNEFTIVLLLFRALLALLKKEDATTAIHEIESLLSEGVSFEEWGFNTVLRCTKNKVSRKAAAVLAALARRINNPQQGHRPHVMKEQTTRPTLESKGQKKSVPLPRKPPLSARENQPALNRPSDGAEGRSITAGN
jgi:tetratricopeptide (TPR) repeat protein